MSALLVDDLLVPEAGAAQWRRVRGPQSIRPVQPVQLHLVPAPEARPTVAQPAPLRLTERGLKVVVSLFVGVFLIAAVVLVGSFLAVSDAPPSAAQAVAASGN